MQTTTPFEKRKSAVEAVLREQPLVGWKLLIALLPHSHGYTSGCHRPVWRDFIPRDWEDGVLRTEYWEQITVYTDLAVSLAKNDTEKLCELIRRLPDLPRAALESVLDHLTTDAVVSLPETDRQPIWENLDELVRRHRKFSGADWVLPEDLINKITETVGTLEPSSPEVKYHYLFSNKDFDLFEERGNFDKQRIRLDKLRQAAISEIIGDGRIELALNFARKVAAPHEVGKALGEIASSEIEEAILPSLLNSEDDILIRVLAGFILARYWKLKNDWVDAVLEKDWAPELRAKFLIFLPFEEQIWERASSNLGKDHEELYWRSAQVNPYGPDRDLTFAIEKLLEYGREGAAVMCIAWACIADDSFLFNEALAIRSLIAVIENQGEVKELDSYQTVELIKRLQESETADKDALFRIEWNFLPWLDRFSPTSCPRWHAARA